MLELATNVQYVKGIGPRIAAILLEKGITTVEDLLYYLPFRYEDRLNPRGINQLKAGEMASVIAEVRGFGLFRTRRMPIFEMTVGQGPSTLKCIWFNATYLEDKFRAGQLIALYGKVDWSSRGVERLEILQPQFEILHDPEESDDPEGALTKADQWRLILPQLGYMALIRNLRNLDEAGITDKEAATLADRIADPEQVRRSRQFPFRFLSAYLNAPSLRWGHALEQALDAATANIPELPGRTLILIDTSASMGQALSRKSAMSMVQAAALFGLATGIRNRDRADLYGFADGQFRVRRSAYRLSLLKSVEAFTRRIGQVGHGTRIAEAVRATYRGHDRVMIFTDMQTFPDRHGWGRHVGDVSASVPARVPVYGFNLVGYRHSAMPAGFGNRHELGGLTDATFSLIPNIEAGLAARWPWAEAVAKVQ